MEFNNANRTQWNKGEGEEYVTDVNFIMEVKTGNSISNFKKGFGQAYMKAQGILNSVPVLVMDDDAYKGAIKSSPSFKESAQHFIDMGGRIMLLDGLNDKAEDTSKDVRASVRSGENPNVLQTGH